MSWVRIDDGFMEHPKVALLTPRDFQVYMRALCYAARRRDAHIGVAILPLLIANQATAERITNVGLWERNGDGWVIHDWDDYQKVDTTNAERQRRHRNAKHNDGSNDE